MVRKENKERTMNRLKCNQVVCIPKSDPIILYKKLGFDMHSPYQFFKYVIGKTYFVKEFNENVHRSCTKNRIYSIPKSELAKWAGSRYFKVHVWGKCILEKKNKVGSEYLKIIEELKPKEFVKYMSSIGAYLYCEIVKDIKTVRDRINGPFEAYLYCKNVKDRKKIRDLIKDSYYAYSYCKMLKIEKI